MKIAIAMRRFEDRPRSADEGAEPECFAEFEIDEGAPVRGGSDEDVQVTVVLRGKRGELENPALGMTELVLRALEARDVRQPKRRDVIDVPGIAVGG